LRRDRGWGGQLVPGDGPLARVHPIAAFAAVAAVFAVGVLVGGPLGVGLLLVLAAGVGLLLAVTWRRLLPAERALRLVALLVLIAIAVTLLR
jgi:energy-coupling factor transporter transmembrane protein EcfT